MICQEYLRIAFGCSLSANIIRILNAAAKSRCSEYWVSRRAMEDNRSIDKDHSCFCLYASCIRSIEERKKKALEQR